MRTVQDIEHAEAAKGTFGSAERQPTVGNQALSDQERQQILVNWNATDRAYSENQTVIDLFEGQVERTPDAVALVFEDDQLTYRELNRRANQVAHYLQRHGVGPEVLVAPCVERSVEMIVGLIGILKAGGAYVPLDPGHPREQLAVMLADARPRVVLTQDRLRERLPEWRGLVVCLDGDADEIAAQSLENPVRASVGSNLAYVIYTSGSTGEPKGVMVEHRSLANFTVSARREYAIEPRDRVLQFASISFDASCEEIYPCLTSGAALVLRTDQMLDSVSIFLRTCSEWQVTVLDLPTAFWHELVTGLDTEQLTSSVRLVIIGGEAALPERLATWRERVGHRVRLLNTYGPTETTVVATVADLSSATDQPLAVPIGRPIANLRVYVLDPELNPVPIGIAGELYIGGAGVCRGYLNRPELTADRFIASLLDRQGGRLYKTGDLVRYRPDGNLEYLGRIDRQVKIRGFRIELGAIETVLRAQPQVQDAVVLAREDRPGDKRLVAYIVPTAGADPSSAALKSAIQQTLPSYMLPTALVSLDALPLTPNGKIDRRALPPPDRESGPREHDFVAPRTPFEDLLARVWEEVLDVHPIGVRDNFFDLGGHSLLAARLVARIEQECGSSLPISILATHGTVEGLAATLLDQNATTDRPPLVGVQTGGAKRPFYYVHGDRVFGGMYCWGLARHLGSERPLYIFEPQGTPWNPAPIPPTMEDIAASFLSLLLDVQPAGPYLLGGYCSGALVAYEMARRLQDAGQTVDLLVMVDPLTSKRRARAIRWALHHAGNLIGLDAVGQADVYVRLRRLSVSAGRWRRRLLNRVYPGRGRGAAADARQESLYTDVDRERIARYDWLDTGYRPGPYRGRIALLAAGEGLGDERVDVVAQSGGESTVEVHMLPGDHQTFITRHLEAFGRQLEACLDSVEQGDRRWQETLQGDPRGATSRT